MFAANPAKRPRRESLTHTLIAMGKTIASALTPSVSLSNEAVVKQV